MPFGHNGDFLYNSTYNPLLDFFSKAGSLSSESYPYYGEQADIEDLFSQAWQFDSYKSFQLLMWMRDCRGGAGNRGDSRKILNWLGNEHPDWVIANLHFIPQVGRWDDLIHLVGTLCEKEAISFWWYAISKGNKLAAKWSPREKSNKRVFNLLKKESKLSIKEFRTLISSLTHVVETQMCNNEWFDINYNHVPSVAMARKAKVFSRHDNGRFQAWFKSLNDPESGNKINASVLYPHDCIRTLFSNENMDDLVNAQFDALPNYIPENKMRVMCLSDFSGSMTNTVSGKLTALTICLGLSLYCSDKLGKDSCFYRKFMPFSEEAEIASWENQTFSEAVRSWTDKMIRAYCGSTNIQAALDLILETAKTFHLTNDQIPNCLMILSDMQFDTSYNCDVNAVETALQKWVDAGYSKPKIVYWNLMKYNGYEDKCDSKNIALVSGYSPSILKAVLSGEDITPYDVMIETISKYEVVNPEIK